MVMLEFTGLSGVSAFGAVTALEKGFSGFSEFSSGAGLPEGGVHGSLFPRSHCFYPLREALRRLFLFFICQISNVLP